MTSQSVPIVTLNSVDPVAAPSLRNDSAENALQMLNGTGNSPNSGANLNQSGGTSPPFIPPLASSSTQPVGSLLPAPNNQNASSTASIPGAASVNRKAGNTAYSGLNSSTAANVPQSLEGLISNAGVQYSLKRFLRNVRPLSELLGWKNFQIPTKDAISPRCARNFRHFTYNYLIFWALILLICVSLMPIVIIIAVFSLGLLTYLATVQTNVIHITSNFSVKVAHCRVATICTASILFLLTLKLSVILLLLVGAATNFAHCALHLEPKYDRITGDFDFDDI